MSQVTDTGRGRLVITDAGTVHTHLREAGQSWPPNLTVLLSQHGLYRSGDRLWARSEHESADSFRQRFEAGCAALLGTTPVVPAGAAPDVDPWWNVSSEEGARELLASLIGRGTGRWNDDDWACTVYDGQGWIFTTQVPNNPPGIAVAISGANRVFNPNSTCAADVLIELLS